MEQIADHLIGINGRAFQGLAASEVEELTCQVHGALCGVHDIGQVLARCMPLRDGFSDELGVAANHLQQVIKFMCDTPRECPDSLQLLGLPQLLFFDADGVCLMVLLQCDSRESGRAGDEFQFRWRGFARLGIVHGKCTKDLTGRV